MAAATPATARPVTVEVRLTVPVDKLDALQKALKSLCSGGVVVRPTFDGGGP